MSIDNNQRIALTFDVELWSEGEWLQPHISPSMCREEIFPDSINRILKTLKDNNSHATFFITLKVTEDYPEIIRDINRNGHEIGVHGPRHFHLNKYTPEGFRQDCEKIISLIMSITGKRPRGFRAAHFSLNRKTMWMLNILKDLGFSYDSSVFPLNMGIYGISESPTTPYLINQAILEIPISVATFGKMRIPFAGGIYFRFLPYLLFKFLLQRTKKQAFPIVYFHPHELDMNTPRITHGPILRRLLKYWGVNRSFKKFNILITDYRCDSIEGTIINQRQ
jgi:polysaccharide deacetylase family protein (PEP-CTERM system associated)